MSTSQLLLGSVSHKRIETTSWIAYFGGLVNETVKVIATRVFNTPEVILTSCISTWLIKGKRIEIIQQNDSLVARVTDKITRSAQSILLDVVGDTIKEKIANCMYSIPVLGEGGAIYLEKYELVHRWYKGKKEIRLLCKDQKIAWIYIDTGNSLGERRVAEITSDGRSVQDRLSTIIDGIPSIEKGVLSFTKYSIVHTWTVDKTEMKLTKKEGRFQLQVRDLKEKSSRVIELAGQGILKVIISGNIAAYIPAVRSLKDVHLTKPKKHFEWIIGGKKVVLLGDNSMLSYHVLDAKRHSSKIYPISYEGFSLEDKINRLSRCIPIVDDSDKVVFMDPEPLHTWFLKGFLIQKIKVNNQLMLLQYNQLGKQKKLQLMPSKIQEFLEDGLGMPTILEDLSLEFVLPTLYFTQAVSGGILKLIEEDEKLLWMFTKDNETRYMEVDVMHNLSESALQDCFNYFPNEKLFFCESANRVWRTLLPTDIISEFPDSLGVRREEGFTLIKVSNSDKTLKCLMWKITDKYDKTKKRYCVVNFNYDAFRFDMGEWLKNFRTEKITIKGSKFDFSLLETKTFKSIFNESLSFSFNRYTLTIIREVGNSFGRSPFFNVGHAMLAIESMKGGEYHLWIADFRSQDGKNGQVFIFNEDEIDIPPEGLRYIGKSATYLFNKEKIKPVMDAIREESISEAPIPFSLINRYRKGMDHVHNCITWILKHLETLEVKLSSGDYFYSSPSSYTTVVKRNVVKKVP